MTEHKAQLRPEERAVQDNFLLCLTCRIPVNAPQNEGCSPYQLVGSAVVYGALQAQMFFGSAAPYQTFLIFLNLHFSFLSQT